VTEPSPDPATGAVDHRLSAIPPAARGLQGRRAGLVSRLLANTVDFCIVALVVAAGYAGAAALRFLWNSRTFTFPAPGFGVLVIVGGVVMVLYLAACWTATGRTYGDHLLGLRVVVTAHGGRHLECDEVVQIAEAGVFRPEVLQTLHKQARSEEQQKAQCYLRHNEPLAEEQRTAASGDGTHGILQRRPKIWPAGAQCGQEAENQTGCDCEHCCKG